MDSRLSAAAEWLRGRLPHPPLVGVILGSGLGDFADGVDERVTIPYGEIPGFPAAAVSGTRERSWRARCAAFRRSFSRGAFTTTRATPCRPSSFPRASWGFWAAGPSS